MHKIITLIFLLFSLQLTAQDTKRKLVVGIVIDQMCYDYLYRFQSRFSEGGFTKLMQGGANCRSVQYNYVPTYTGPGHASIYTGTTPSDHGIIANDWYSRDEKKEVNCVEDKTVNPVGTNSQYGYFAPTRLKTATITDQLKMTYPKAKVVSMSIKNRGAILPGGHLSDGSYWFDYTNGDFITSSYFKEELPNWVQKFNQKNYPQKSLQEVWKTLYSLETYSASREDNSPYEHLLPGKSTPEFPYNLKEMDSTGENFGLFTVTPFANDYLTNFAMEAIEKEELGQDNFTDMLCISYSSTDIAGHAFGSHSIEIEDMYLRLDKNIEALISALDEQVGKNNYTLFLTADHAVVPVPQYFIDHNMPGGYAFLDERMEVLQGELHKRYGDSLIEEFKNLNIYLDWESIERLQVDYTTLSEFLTCQVEKWDEVKRLYTRKDLRKNKLDEWGEKIKNGFHPKESGDVIITLQPGYLPKHHDSETARKGTSHGSAYMYDSHVPLLWYGAGIPKGDIFETIEITDIAPTLSHLLNISFPATVTGKPIVSLWRK